MITVVVEQKIKSNAAGGSGLNLFCKSNGTKYPQTVSAKA
jgi:hypothetical protein